MARLVPHPPALAQGTDLLRADSGFAREELMAWCEEQRVDDVAPGFRTGRFFSYAALAILMSTLACAGVRYPTLE